MPSHNHSADSLIYWQSGATSNLIQGASSSSWTLSVKNVGNTGGGQGHTHTISTTSTNSGAASGNTANTGSGSGHNHSFTGDSQDTMPPYITCYMWTRTA